MKIGKFNIGPGKFLFNEGGHYLTVSYMNRPNYRFLRIWAFHHEFMYSWGRGFRYFKHQKPSN